MARDGNGDYTAPSNTVNPATTGTAIDSADFNEFVDDVETALSESVFTGASSGTDNALIRADGTSGKKVQETGITIDDSDVISGATLSSPVINVGSDAHGDIYFRNSSGNLARLAPGTAGQTLVSGGPGADPSFSAAGSGDVTSGSNVADNAIVRGDGGAKGVQQSGITIDDTNNISGVNNVTGADTNFVTGTAGATNEFGVWNVDGDLVGGVAQPAGTIVGTTDAQTLTNKTLTDPTINVGSDAQGDIYYRNASGGFERLAPGTSGQFLKTQGAAADPIWETLAGGGDLLAANNLSDVASAATAFANIKQAASDTATGVVELATTTEALAGTDTSRAVTAAGLAAAAVRSVQSFTTSGTWTRPTGCKYIKVTCIGGGGAGGGSAATSSNVSCGGSGGGGGASIEYIDVTSLASATVTVGAGGSGSSGSAGGSGGTSSFGTGPLLQATGGSGGSVLAAGTSINLAAGGAGGSGSLGDINIDGGGGGVMMMMPVESRRSR